jgi:hypothetical protein
MNVQQVPPDASEQVQLAKALAQIIEDYALSYERAARALAVDEIVIPAAMLYPETFSVERLCGFLVTLSCFVTRPFSDKSRRLPAAILVLVGLWPTGVIVHFVRRTTVA